jgi:alanine-glyoxylate transaminase/serine-glyoxylate transaminase/serine-pyruvate transaminase
MMISEGRENIFRRHKVLSGAVWAALDLWGEEGVIIPNIKKQSQRSTAVTTIRADGYDLTTFRKWLELNTGLVVGLGLGFSGQKYLDGKSVFRIGHMGHLNPVMILGVLTSIEAGFFACGIPFGKGGAGAAAQFIAQNSY